MTATTRKPGGARLAAILLLAAPLALYLVLYLMPLASVIALSVDNGEMGRSLTRFQAADPTDRDAQAAALLADMQAMTSGQQATVARELNQEVSGFRSLFLNTARAADQIAPTAAGLVEFDDRWQEARYWTALETNASRWTSRHFQKATGIQRDAEGRLTRGGDDIYLTIMLRTLRISAQVTVVTLLIGFPLAYAVANAGPGLARIVLITVLMSFWISALVRTTAWVVLLQTNGLVNKTLQWLGIIAEPLQLIFNRFGAVVSMTHVLLPFAIIPMMNVMRTIPKSQTDASRSLGAGPIESFLRVYLPQAFRGVIVGGGTVFILTLGFYITPALTGGPSDQMVAFYIADFIQRSLNWGMASALSVLLLALVAALAGGFGVVRWLGGRRRGVV